MSSTVARRLLPILLVSLAFASGCSGDNPYDSAKSTTPGVAETPVPETGPDTTVNDFLPERANVSDCIGAVERPNCGSKAKGDWRMYLTFGLLIAGMSFIGWRVVRGVRSSDVRR